MVVVASFTASLWYSHYRLEAMEASVQQITTDSAPSLEHITRAHADLLEIELSAQTLIAAPFNAADVSAGDGLRATIEKNRRQLQSELTALPVKDAAEAMLTDKMLASLETFDDEIGKVLQLPPGSDLGTRHKEHASLRAAVRALDGHLVGLSNQNTTEARENAEHVTALRLAARRTARNFGIFSLFTAALATTLALLVFRRQRRLLEAHEALMLTRSRELEGFADRVAHDIKNPLQLLAMRTTIMLERQDLDAASRETGERLIAQVRGLDELIEALLEFARAGGQPDASAVTDVGSVITNIHSDLSLAAADAGVQLLVDPFTSAQVRCTAGGLTSVLSNLLYNAIKYTDDNRPDKRIRVRVNTNATMVHFEVEDTGPGLPAGAEEIIFKPYFRLPGTKPAGIGLGLATVKRIVAAYDGEVGVRSTLGLGSCFWFDLPRADQGETSRVELAQTH